MGGIMGFAANVAEPNSVAFTDHIVVVNAVRNIFDCFVFRGFSPRHLLTVFESLNTAW